MPPKFISAPSPPNNAVLAPGLLPWSQLLLFFTTIFCRGGVKDTRLEVKAKDTKKIRGQGQEQTLSRPRPRTKDTDASVFQRKKTSLKFFFRRSQKKIFKNFFSERSLLEKTKKRFLQIFRKVSGVFQRNFNGSKIMLSSSRGQGNFRGLEASRPRTSSVIPPLIF